MERTAQSLLADYVALCNRVLAETRARPWYRRAIDASRAVFGDMRVRTVVYDREPANRLAEFTLHFDAGQNRVALEAPGGRELPFSWKVPVAYLEDVVRHRPQWYLAQPVRLDWRWLGMRAQDVGGSLGRSGVFAVALGAAIALLAAVCAVRASARARRARLPAFPPAARVPTPREHRVAPGSIRPWR